MSIRHSLWFRDGNTPSRGRFSRRISGAGLRVGGADIRPQGFQHLESRTNVSQDRDVRSPDVQPVHQNVYLVAAFHHHLAAGREQSRRVPPKLFVNQAVLPMYAVYIINDEVVPCRQRVYFRRLFDSGTS
ncbi:hypothetical protein J6590_093205 [Homalodisca vitripennis]|nr:hypothetical protein J6590_019539 [Homalodisca vitripennis]KAG8275140.1 hypothetical protein J6590_093205 [Homalodisca vitripennis]